MRIHIALALTAALSIAGASGKESDARSISEFLWPLPIDTYPSIQPAAASPARSAVEPIVYKLQEEGRRKIARDKKIDKGVSVSISISTDKDKDKDQDKNRPHDHGHYHNEDSGHNTPIKPAPGAPIYVAGSKPAAHKPQQPVQVVVEDSNSSWGWGWIKGIMDGPSWGWGSSSDDHHHHDGAYSISDSDVAGDDSEDDDGGIISVSYGKPPSDYAGPGSYNPFSGWWYPTNDGTAKPGDKVQVHPMDSPTMSEVMVIRYPEFIKTIGKGISKMTNAMKNIGKGVTTSFTKGINTAGAGIGSGVAAIIPLEEVGNAYHNMGGDSYDKVPSGSGHGHGYKPGSPDPDKRPTHAHSASVVYVDKYPSIQGPTSDNSWFKPPSSWFSSDTDHTSSVYVDRPKGGYYHSHPHEHV